MKSSLEKHFATTTIFGVILLFSIPGMAQKGAPVRVVNSTAAPVPTAAQGTTTVAGTVNVGNTPNVNVANTPNVNVANTPSVNVANSPTVTLSSDTSVNVANSLDSQGNPSPLAVLEAAQPYSDSCNASIGNGWSCTFSRIPAGKRVVIQEFDLFAGAASGIRPYQVRLAIPNNHYFVSTFQGTFNGSDYYSAHQETHLYAPAGLPECVVAFTGDALNAFYTCAFSGYLVDVPQ